MEKSVDTRAQRESRPPVLDGNPTESGEPPPPVVLRTAATLLGLVGAALAVRVPLLAAPGHVDEFYSGLAARGILERGFPFFPSGLYYDRDIAYHYALAGALDIGDTDLQAGRWLSLLAGLAVIPLVFALVRRLSRAHAPALIAAALAALDPISASMAPRMRMYPWLQVACLLVLLAFERDFVRHAAATHRWRWRTALAWFCALSVHRLTIFLAPALALVAIGQWLASRKTAPSSTAQPTAFPWRSVLLVAASTWAAWRGPSALAALASSQPGFIGVVTWGGASHTSPAGAYFADLDLLSLYQVKWASMWPSTWIGVGKAALWLAVGAIATAALTRRARWTDPAVRLALYTWLPLALIVAYPHYELPARWVVHLEPMLTALLGWAAWRSIQSAAPAGADCLRPRAWLVFTAGFLAALAVVSPTSGLWPWRHALLAAFALSGPALLRPESLRLRGAPIQVLATVGAGSVFLWIHMSVGLWWADNAAWARAGSEMAPFVRPDDAIVVAGNCPSIEWALQRVDAAIPFWRLEYAIGGDDRPDVELTSGAPLVRTVDELAALGRDHRIWYFGQALGAPSEPHVAQRHHREVEAPLLQWVYDHTYTVKSYGHALEVRTSCFARNAPQ